MSRRILTCSTSTLLVLLSAAPALAAGDGGGLPIWDVINFAILVGALIYFGRGPMQEMFSTRRTAIASEMEAASALLDQAEARNAEWQRKLADLDRDLEDIRVTARRRAEEERERILAEASEAADRIQRDAVASVDQELRRAQDELRQEAASLATELASGILQNEVGDSDRDRLVDEFISRVGSSGADAGGGH